MLIPSKLVAYRKSVVSKFVPIISFIKEKNEPVEVKTMYKEFQGIVSGVDEYIDILVCLFYLDMIKFNDDKTVIEYVERNSE